MRKAIVVLTQSILLAFIAVAPATGQFSGFEKKDAGSGGGASKADVELQQEQLVKKFVGAQRNLLQAQALVAEALGLKGDKEKLDAERDALSKGNVDKKALKKSVRLTKDAQKAIDKKTAEGKALSDTGKKLMAKSLVPYAKSVAGVTGMVGDAKTLADGIQAQIKAAGAMGAMKVKKAFDVGLYVAPKVPGLAAGMTKQLGSMVSYAKKNGVRVPKEATDLI
jgi:hypothetical protein